MRWICVLSVLGVLAESACVSSSGFQCSTDVQCGAVGKCEVTGFCSFADTGCGMGRRYGEHGGGFSNMCVGEDGAVPRPDGGDSGPVTCIDELAVGAFHACVRKGGRVECWGSGDDAQLGDGRLVRQSTPTPVSGLTDAAELAAGFVHTCVRTSTGKVKCWGSDGAYQIAAPDRDYHPVPEEIPGLPLVKRLSTQFFFTCAIDMADNVWCWGDNQAGQLGHGMTNQPVQPVQVVGLPSGARAIAAGRDHACAIVKTPADEVWCWGQNMGGALGDGTLLPRAAPVKVMLDGVAEIAAGQGHTCARKNDGTVWCWGQNGAYQLARRTPDMTGMPMQVPQVSGATAVIAGHDSSCARVAGGEYRCWGNDSFAKLGDGSGTYNQDVPTVNQATGALELDLGEQFGCARFATGVRCWGANFFGQLGDGVLTHSPRPVTAALTAQAQVSCGAAFTCSRSMGGLPFCWGQNGDDQLGTGGNVQVIPQPTQVATLTGITSIHAGVSQACALVGGAASCWGDNMAGILGDNQDPPQQRATPTPVFMLTTAADLSLSVSHMCARKADGSVVCWGQNTAGQLGDGTMMERHLPVASTITTGATSVATGNDFTCAVVGGGLVSCRGDNDDGTLGVGDNVAHAGVVTVQKAGGGDLTGVLEVVAGLYHVCARTASEVYCWGDGYAGQIGDGGGSPRNLATLVPGLAAQALAAGYKDTCALIAGGTVRCWGDNFFGQIGDGTQDTRTTPANVMGLSGVTQISVGYGHACARKGDGTLACWGNNEDGQLGTVPVVLRTMPVDVLLTCP